MSIVNVSFDASHETRQHVSMEVVQHELGVGKLVTKEGDDLGGHDSLDNKTWACSPDLLRAIGDNLRDEIVNSEDGVAMQDQ
jgi:hypothetical protein